MRAYAGESDLARVIELLLACRAAGQADMEFRSIELRMLLGGGAFDAARYTRLWDGPDGALAAFGVLWQGRYLGMLVHPRSRGGVEADVLAWAADRVRADAAPGASRRLWALCRSDDSLCRALLERDGFALHDAEWRMFRPLDEPIPEPRVPPGFAIRPLDAARELDAWLDLYIEAFGRREGPLRRWRGLRSDRDYEPALDLVAVDPNGALCGACTCTIASAEAAREAVMEGHAEPVMVREPYRNHGLGRALVLTGLHALRERGMHVAALTTEQDNAAAHRFYARLGYQHVYDGCWYAREV
jgi:mycothiol synthase